MEGEEDSDDLAALLDSVGTPVDFMELHRRRYDDLELGEDQEGASAGSAEERNLRRIAAWAERHILNNRLAGIERKWLERLLSASAAALRRPASMIPSQGSSLLSPASSASPSSTQLSTLSMHLCRNLLLALLRLRNEACSEDSQERFSCMPVALSPVTLAELLQASRTASGGDDSRQTSTSRTIPDNAFPAAGFVSSDLAAFLHSEEALSAPSTPSTPSSPARLSQSFTLDRNSNRSRMTASSVIPRSPFILMARLQLGTYHRSWTRKREATSKRETNKRKGVGFYLEDETGCMACEITEPDPYAIGHIILVTKVNYVPMRTTTPHSSDGEMPGYLEISQWRPLLDPGNTRSAPPSANSLINLYKPLPPRHLALRGGVTRVLFEQRRPDSTDDPPMKRKKRREIKKNVSIVGKLTALSPIKWTADKPQFLLQLSVSYNRKTRAGAIREVLVEILFGDPECVRWYPCLVMDKSYLLTDLRPALLFQHKEAFAATPKTTLYIFDESIPPSPILNRSRESSSLLLFDSTLWEHVRGGAVDLALAQGASRYGSDMSPASHIPSPCSSPSSPSSVSSSPSPIRGSTPISGLSLVDTVHKRLVNYEGVITSYLGHGIFELDGRADRKLFLCHYYTPHLSRIVRRGNTVRLFNVHLILKPWHSTLYSSDEFSNLVEGFGCCSFSRVMVVQFGQECHPPYPLSSSRKSLDALLYHYPLSVAPWILQAHNGLEKRWASDRKHIFVGEDRGLLRPICGLAGLRKATVNIWEEFISHNSCSITRPVLGLPELPTISEFSSMLARNRAVTCTTPYVVASRELSKPVMLVGKLNDANELVDDTGRIRIEIIDLDVHMLGSFICLTTFQIVFTPTGDLCILASVSEAVFHSPSAALDQQLSIPPAQTVTKSKHDQGPSALQRDFLIVAGDRLVHKAKSVGQLLRFEAFRLSSGSLSTDKKIIIELPTTLHRYYGAIKVGEIYRLIGASALNEHTYHLHTAGRIECVRVVTEDGRTLNPDPEMSNLTTLLDRPAITITEPERITAVSTVKESLLRPSSLQPVHELLELDMAQHSDEPIRNDRIIGASEADTLNLYAEHYVLPKALMPGARVASKSIVGSIMPFAEQFMDSSARAALAVLRHHASFTRVTQGYLYDLQCRPCLRLSLTRLSCTITAFFMLSLSLGSHQELVAEAEVAIDDSTGEAKLFVPGALVMSLMGFSNEEITLIIRGLLHYGAYKHDQSEGEASTSAKRWPSPVHIPTGPASPPSLDPDDLLLPSGSEVIPAVPEHVRLLRERMGLVTRPSVRWGIVCRPKLPAARGVATGRLNHRWYETRKRKAIEVKEALPSSDAHSSACMRATKQHTWAAPRLLLEAKHIQRM